MEAKILFVDDEPDFEALIVQKFRRQIRAGEVQALFAHDGVHALALLEENPDVDMVISDINMPRMDGLTLLRTLQDADEKISTVIVSAYGDMANIRTAMNCGAFDFLTKPFDFADLELTISKTLQHVEILRDARERLSSAERANAALSRYFSPNLVDRLTGGADDVALGGQRREIASLFTDITGFTTLVETLEPDILGPLLNDYLTGMADIIFEHEGTLTKIIGDSLHVLFGAPGDQADMADRGIACALALNDFAARFQKAMETKGVSLGLTRIGLHSGQAIVGNFGGTRYFDYTAYGDTINTAARLEAANKTLGTAICISEAAVAMASSFRGRTIGDLVLRGRTDAIRSYEPRYAPHHTDEASAEYARAFALLDGNAPEAVAAFAALVSAYPDDRLATFHLKRLLNGEAGTRIVLT